MSDLKEVHELQHVIREGETPREAADRVRAHYAEIEKCRLCGRDRNGAPNLIYDPKDKKFHGICGPCARKR